MTPWLWFLIAALAAAAGSALLLADRGRQSSHQRERRQWAALRGWRFVPSDPALTEHWRYGVIAGAGLARDAVTGSLFTPLGRRLVRVFDHDRGGQVTHAVVAVQRRAQDTSLVMELWLPGQPLPEDPSLITLSRVGDRIALTSDPDQARPLVTPEFAFAANALGQDIPVAWLEQGWVLAAAPRTATPTRLERLLRALDEIADLLDIASAEDADGTPDAVADLAELSGWACDEFSSRQ
ncbi:MAG TPA: hypothetical protein VFO16_17170 [Pseudonocardiaceae bacterium]|nr:hypothetical protein [Pseudonocardiaceae bacterium]